jgi:Na+-driven multidrug efflux pump
MLFITLLAVLNLVLTYVFIQYVFHGEFKAAGAACSTALSLIIYNLMKTGFVYYHWKIVPFTVKTLFVLLIGLLSYLVLLSIPFHFNPYINILIRGLLMCCLFFAPIIFLKFSKDLNQIVFKYFHKVFPI